MAHPPDVGGNFKSDPHRRVVGHLSHPDDTFGWSLPGLHSRLQPTKLTEDEVKSIVDEHVTDGYVEEPVPGVYRMTQKAFDELNGSNANEPDESGDTQPAQVPLHGSVSLAPTSVGE